MFFAHLFAGLPTDPSNILSAARSLLRMWFVATLFPRCFVVSTCHSLPTNRSNLGSSVRCIIVMYISSNVTSVIVGVLARNSNNTIHHQQTNRRTGISHLICPLGWFQTIVICPRRGPSVVGGRFQNNVCIVPKSYPPPRWGHAGG